jgi:hypothetical protein
MCGKEIEMIMYLKTATSIAVSNNTIFFFKILLLKLRYVILYYRTLRNILVRSQCLLEGAKELVCVVCMVGI